MAMTRGMNMGNRKIDYERAANLGKAGKEGSEVKEATVESLSVPRLAFDSVRCGTPLSDVGLSRGFALHLRIGQARRPGSGDEVVV
jgi:hypothetical protein